MTMDNQFDHEAEELENQLAQGAISNREYNREMLDLQRAYKDASIESAQNAYDREMERW
jgi:hypothetical protein